MGLIYIARNQENEKKYIGQTTIPLNKRFKEHKQRGHYFHNSLKKNGLDNFHITSIEMPDTALDVMEDLLIDHFNSLVPNGYNLQGGGSHGKHSEESKKKMSESSKGCKAWNKGLKGVQVPWNKGKKCPQLSESKKGSKHPMFGKGGPKHYKAKPIILIHLDGTEEYFGCMSDACRKHSLNSGHLSLVAKGKQKHHKRFKCRYI